MEDDPIRLYSFISICEFDFLYTMDRQGYFHSFSKEKGRRIIINRCLEARQNQLIVFRWI